MRAFVLFDSHCLSLGWPSESLLSLPRCLSPQASTLLSITARLHHAGSGKPRGQRGGVPETCWWVASAEGWAQGLLLTGDVCMVLKKPPCAAGKLGLMPSHKPQGSHPVTQAGVELRAQVL